VKITQDVNADWAWTGANDLEKNGQWSWSDQSPFSQKQVRAGFPAFLRPNGANQCNVVLAADNGHKFHRAPCASTQKHYICKKASDGEIDTAMKCNDDNCF